MKINTYLDYKVILANRAQPVCFATQFQAPEISAPRPQPVAFCIVLDRSGSMDGPPLHQAKEAAKLAVRNLRPADQFSLIAFDTAAQVLIPLQPVADKAEVLKKIDAIQAGNSTNLTSGWSLGRDELKKAPQGVTRRLLLLTDGLLNVGIVEPAQVRNIVSSGLEGQGIRTSCLGFGDGYNEDLLTQLAQATSGQFYDATSAEKFAPIFASELDGLQKLAVQNVRLRLQKLDFCETLEPLGNPPWVSLPDGRTEFAVGDLVSSEERVLCFQLGVLPLPCIAGQAVASLEGERLLGVEILWDELDEKGISSQTLTQTIRIQATQDPAEVKVCGEVVPWVALQQAGKTMKAATDHMDAGRVEDAAGILKRSIHLLKQYGAASQTGEAVESLEMLLAFIEGGTYNPRSRKLSQYLSHSYGRMSSKEMWVAQAPMPSFKQEHRAPPPAPSGPATTADEQNQKI